MEADKENNDVIRTEKLSRATRQLMDYNTSGKRDAAPSTLILQDKRLRKPRKFDLYQMTTSEAKTEKQGNGNENELASWHQNEFHSLGQCNDFLQQNYIKIDTTLQRHAKRRNARVIIVGCGDKEKLAKTKLQYEMYHKRGTDT